MSCGPHAFSATLFGVTLGLANLVLMHSTPGGMAGEFSVTVTLPTSIAPGTYQPSVDCSNGAAGVFELSVNPVPLQPAETGDGTTATQTGSPLVQVGYGLMLARRAGRRRGAAPPRNGPALTGLFRFIRNWLIGAAIVLTLTGAAMSYLGKHLLRWQPPTRPAWEANAAKSGNVPVTNARPLARSQPVRIFIPKIHVWARVEPRGLGPNGTVGVPSLKTPFLTTWFDRVPHRASAAPRRFTVTWTPRRSGRPCSTDSAPFAPPTSSTSRCRAATWRFSGSTRSPCTPRPDSRPRPSTATPTGRR